eukprot:Phypoly_transcript_12602.p1 GENE.Phypoly_transcript_12602~~Phypoly_transcript_12602.p1  ORF type:complete len:309 (-),score=26.63 Phypoly_transcript_12602:100-1026(-)
MANPEDPKEEAKAEAKQTRIAIVIMLYMLCSSTMLIINKAAVKMFPAPSALLFLQTGVSAFVIWVGGIMGWIKVDPLEFGKIKAFCLVTVIFMLNIFTNIKALENSNVETVIVFQTLTSLVIAYGDYKLLNSGTPSPKVILSLGIIVTGALCYMYSDSELKMDTYFWVFMYFFAKTVDMLYTKHICDTVPMTSWGRSFYNNFLSMFPWAVMAIAKEADFVLAFYEEGSFTGIVFTVVVLSCLVGIGISIVGFMAREAITATSFSVVGNMNKVLTVFINYFIWDNHASMKGLLSLLICLVGGAYYAKVR